MRSLISRLDRKLAATALVLAGSAALLVIGLASILVAMNDSGANLPNAGSLDEIVSDVAEPTQSDGSPAGPPPPLPVRVGIPRLYIDAPVVTLGVDEKRRAKTPDRPDQVAWYNFSSAPGLTSNAVFSGHVDWQTQTGVPIPGVFYRLRELEIGDTVTITLENKKQLQYRVTGNVAASSDNPNISKAMQGTAKDVITLITCGGSWLIDRSQEYGGNYSHRVLVRAERVPGSAVSAAGD